MSSSPETTTRTAGAHRARREARDRGAARAVAQRTPARYEPYLDGLFTYCLSVLCDHDAATGALADVLALAERRRGPEDSADRRAWLYALARWACLRKLAEARRRRQGHHAAGRQHDEAETLPEDVRQRRRRELALLAWPEAAGTTPEQREALELAVRHRLSAGEVAAVLGMTPPAARELLSSGACEVERTRAALAVVEAGGCPAVARLAGERQMVLSTAVRRELVRHVDDCPRCRRTAERAISGRWPGAMISPAELPVLQAPRAALCAASAHVTRASAPRFDRRGFPLDPKDRAARRDRLRARAVTTTVVATVVAAPALALWAAYRGGPGDGADEHPPASSGSRDSGSESGIADGYENAGNASDHPGRGGKTGEDVSVEVARVAGADRHGADRLEVSVAVRGDVTLITLTAAGDEPVAWSVSSNASWLYVNQSSGTLAPGESFTVKVRVDRLREPSGAWSARVAVAPAGAVVTISGHGPVPTPGASRPGHPTGSPSGQDPGPTAPSTRPPDPDDPPSGSPGPDPEPSDPGPSAPPSPSAPSDGGSVEPGSPGDRVGGD